MFGQNQDDQQVVVPPPDNVASAPTNPAAAVPEPPTPDDQNIIKPNPASTTEQEPEVQPLSPPQDDDLAIPDDIKPEDVAPSAIPEPAEPTTQPAIVPQDDDDEDDKKEATAPEINISEEGSAYTSNRASNDSDVPADLTELKRKALQDLSPLVDELDQAPEEKFRTTMMLIQAADNKDLLPKAYEAAKAIDDDKVKAQALLDVVNEINYFSQSKE